jgi:hypothetical protein
MWLGRPSVQYDIFGAPARATSNAQYVVPYDVVIYFETLPAGDHGNQKLCTVHLCKIKNPGTNVDFFLIKSYGKSLR